MEGGTRLSTSQRWSTLCKVLNMGKAVNTANATVKNGTKAMVVVKVRLLAVKPKWSSRKRSRRVNTVSRQGKLRRRCAASATSNMAAMMPSPCSTPRLPICQSFDPLCPLPPPAVCSGRAPSPWAACWLSCCSAWAGSCGGHRCGPVVHGWPSKCCRCALRCRAC